MAMEVTYEFAIFPDQEKMRPVPEVGDVFVVTAIYRDVLDTHWGKCTVVVLRPTIEVVRVKREGMALPLIVVDDMDW